MWDRCSYAAPFLSPEWILPWWRHLFGGGELWTIALWRGAKLAGLAPMFIHGHAEREVSFAGSGVSDYLGFLTDDEVARPATQKICDHICRSASRWNHCNLVEIAPESPLPDAVFDSGFALEKGFAVEKSDGSVCPVLTLPPCMEVLDGCLSPKFRHNLRNSSNRLRDSGVVFENAAAEQDAEYVEALIRLHGARWRARGEPGVLADPAMQDFLREVTREFRARGWLRFCGLRDRGELHAVTFNFCARGRWFYYLVGFDQKFAAFSPGNLLIRFAIGEAIRENAREFDFLRNGEPYKYKWRAQNRVNSRIFVRQESSAASR